MENSSLNGSKIKYLDIDENFYIEKDVVKVKERDSDENDSQEYSIEDMWKYIEKIVTKAKEYHQNQKMEENSLSRDIRDFSSGPEFMKWFRSLSLSDKERFVELNYRKERIKGLWKKIHGDRVPCFNWQFHPDMFYWYNKETNSIECDCGLVIPVTLKDEELNERNLRKLIRDMEDKIYTDYKKTGFDLGYRGD